MFDKKDLEQILDLALETGGDFAELFFESTSSNLMEMTMGNVSKANSSNVNGVGIRILKDTEEVYGYTNDVSLDNIKKFVIKLSSSYVGKRTHHSKHLEEVKYKNITPVIKRPNSISNEEKKKYLLTCYDGANSIKTNNSKQIKQIICTLTDKEQNVLIVNSDGIYVKDTRTNCRISLSVVATDGTNMQSASNNTGRNMGFEFFDNEDLFNFGKEVANSAMTMLDAKEINGGKMTVVVHHGFGGVLLHEACVHSLEATSVAKGVSVFCGKLGQKIASDIVTAVDDGTLENYWGSLNVDDEGHPTKRNVLIENGILKTYLVDYRNSRIMNHPTTGSGRRESYKYSPTSRMTNTFFTNGTSSFEEIIKNTEYGLFAKSMGGGSVDPSTGEFNFAVQEGYLIEHGKLTTPVKGATLVGSGAEVLMNIDMIANNLTTGHGMCGSKSGSIPTDVGQPTIRVQNMTVGGRG